MLEKLFFADEETMAGSKQPSAEMKQRQEELMGKINEERLSVKEMRDESKSI